MKNKVIKEKEQSNVNVPGLIIAMILLIAILIGGFFLGRWFIANSTTKQDENTTPVVDEGKETADRLLQLLNDNINKTKMGDEPLASEVTSFSYKEKHFYISGYNGGTVYLYNLDLSSQSLNTTKEALDFVKTNTIEGSYDITLNRCTPSESNEFTSKYVTSGVSGKYHIATFGSEQYAYATLLKDEQIVVINSDTLSDALSSTYSPLTISSGDPLFNVYKFIASK